MDPVDAPPPETETRPGATAHPPIPPGAPEEPPRAARALRTAPERREVTLILGLVLLLNYLPGGLLQFVNLRWGLLLSQVFFIAAPAFLAIRWFYLDGRAILPLRFPGRTALLGAVLGIIGLNHVINYSQFLQDRHFPMPKLWRSLFDALTAYDGPFDFILLILLVGVVPGVCEELLFRGFVQAGLRRAFESDAKAVVVGALVFAGFHLNPWSFSFLLIVGLYLGFLVQRTRSLVPAMVAHALNNVLSLLLSALGGQAQEAIVRSPWSHMMACACLAAAALLLRRAPA
jgi:membrane protease YdiL (CAAX protease family)